MDGDLQASVAANAIRTMLSVMFRKRIDEYYIKRFSNNERHQVVLRMEGN